MMLDLGEVMERGKLIILCGIDGCGKSSIIDALTKEGEPLESYMVCKHPPQAWFDNPKIRAAYLDEEGEKIEDEEEIQFTHDIRRQEEKEIILPTLLKQKNMVYHRYIFSLYAYYTGINKLSVAELTEIYSDLLLPDKVIYLKMSVEEFYRRFQSKEQLSYQKNIDYVKRVMQCYEELAKKYNWAIVDTEHNTLEESIVQVRNIIGKVQVTDQFYNLNNQIYQPL